MQKKIALPLTDEVLKDLKAGDNVLLNGVIYVARDAAHKRMVAALEEEQDLPFDKAGIDVFVILRQNFVCKLFRLVKRSLSHIDVRKAPFRQKRFRTVGNHFLEKVDRAIILLGSQIVIRQHYLLIRIILADFYIFLVLRFGLVEPPVLQVEKSQSVHSIFGLRVDFERRFE